MKKLLIFLLLILCLSPPVLAGHTITGGFYCNCNDPLHTYAKMTIEDGEGIEQDETPDSEVYELEILIDAILIFIRL
jgi:hypothetical protein